MQILTAFNTTGEEIRLVENVKYEWQQVAMVSVFEVGEMATTPTLTVSNVQTIQSDSDTRIARLKRYHLISGAVCVMWLIGALSALVSHIHAEPFFALFFSTFGLFVVFAIKLKETQAAWTRTGLISGKR